MKRESVGVVETQCYRIPEEIVLEHGDRLSGVNVAYETYGKINNEKEQRYPGLSRSIRRCPCRRLAQGR